MRRLRILAMAAFLLVLVASCDSTTTSTTTLPPLPAPDPGIAAAPPTTDAPVPPASDPSPYTYRGFLPSGVDYVATIPGVRAEELKLVTGTFFYMSDEGPVPVGDVKYTRASNSSIEVGYRAGVLRLQNRVWSVEVAFDPAIVADLGSLVEETVTRAVSLDVLEDTPVLRLSTPFTWVGGDPQVGYQTFVIASGCWEMAARCSDNHSVQILSAPEIFVGTRGLSQEQIDSLSIETSAIRSVSDPNFLDPGPLDERLSADLIWTGEEMIVWGGKQARDGPTTLVDGAAFNPETNGWKMIARFPLDGPQATRAVWGDGEMIVVSPNGTFGYDPMNDTWRTIGSGVVPSEWNDRMLYFEGKVFVWARSSEIHELTMSTGVWRSIDAPIASSTYPYPHFGVLRAVGGRLVAVTLRGSGCSGESFWELDGDSWEPLPEVSLVTSEYADCSAANQAAPAGGEMVIWDEENHPSAIYSFEDNAWRDLAPIPLGGSEGPPGPVPMDENHFLVPRWGKAAVFDTYTEEWVRVVLPGGGTDAEMVWTGKEFLAWGIWETFDAWRWTPDSGG